LSTGCKVVAMFLLDTTRLNTDESHDSMRQNQALQDIT
jgi:hypothetical protein